MSDRSDLRRARWMIPLALLTAGLAHASVDPTGQLVEEIQIETPTFHAITPNVALRYASSGGNGFAGVGWRVDVGPTITRVSASRGIPRNDASDRFLLDGQTLVACVDGSPSPSCATAKLAFGSVTGFFSTRVESYERLRRDANGWTLWRRDGTQLTLASVDGGLTYRVSEVKDTHGNRVRHTWWCDEACYPDTITYADQPGIPGALIRFVRELRPDPLSSGNGAGFTRTKYRLHAIEVRMDGQLLRAYQLGYTQSLANAASIVSSIQEFGRDAVVSNGTYSAGPTPASPAKTFTTPSLLGAGTQVNLMVTNNSLTAMNETRVPYLPQLDGYQVSYSLGVVVDNDGDHVRPHGQLSGDFNGDGRVDWLVWSVRSKDCTDLETNTVLSTKRGHQATVRSTLLNVVGHASAISQPFTPCPALAIHVADVNGDRHDDLLVISDGKLSRVLAGAAGTFAVSGSSAWPTAPDQRCAIGDLDGDRRADPRARAP
ncbi:MAG: SpvB/TcaC N-terminal domain-containing protein [Kofleriaceae bacterium]